MGERSRRRRVLRVDKDADGEGKGRPLRSDLADEGFVTTGPLAVEG